MTVSLQKGPSSEMDKGRSSTVGGASASTRRRAGAAEHPPARTSSAQDDPTGKASLSTTPLPPRGPFIQARVAVWMHTILVFSAFGLALALGVKYDYYKIVRNRWHRYPVEWFPSISATIGDYYPQRSVFQYLMATAAFPRFAMMLADYSASPPGFLRLVILLLAFTRALSAGGWTYVTSSDSSFPHELAMAVYLLSSITFHILNLDPNRSRLHLVLRAAVPVLFLTAVGVGAHFYIQHKVHRVGGAYSRYAVAEWSLILIDVLGDHLANYHLTGVRLTFTDRFSLVAVGSGAHAADVPNNEAVLAAANAAVAAAQAAEAAAKASAKAGGVHQPAGSMVGQAVPAVIATHGRPAGALGAGLAFLSDCVQSALHWTYATSLLTMIWFFPLFNMGMSGHEAAIVGSFMTILLAVPRLRRLVARSNVAASVLRAVALAAGIGAAWVEEPAERLGLGGIALAASSILKAAALSELTAGAYRKAAAAHVLGLIATVVLRVSFGSGNPLWPVLHPDRLPEAGGGWHRQGLVVGGLAVLERLLRRGLRPRVAHLFPVGLIYGTLVALTHWMLTDIAVIPRMVVQHYPDHGPMPLPWGLLLVPALSFGLLCGLFTGAAGSTLLWAFGAVGAYLLMWRPTPELGFAGGLAVAFQAACVWPATLRALSRLGGRAAPLAITLGHVVFLVGLFFQAFVVAYAFVPGGVYFREKSGLLAALTALVLLLGTRRYFGTGTGGRLGASAPLERLSVWVVVILLHVGLVLAVQLRTRHIRPTGMHPVRMVYEEGPATAAANGQDIGPRYRPDTLPGAVPPAANMPTLTVGIWTIHFGYDNEMWLSHERMARLIEDMDIDVIGLLESDTMRSFIGNRDVPLQLGERLGMYADYGPGPLEHTWGCAMLSRYPIVRSRHELLPSPVGELACAIYATIAVPISPATPRPYRLPADLVTAGHDGDGHLGWGTDPYDHPYAVHHRFPVDRGPGVAGEDHRAEAAGFRLVDVIISHNGQEEDPLDRELQTRRLATLLRHGPRPSGLRPVAFAGYVVTKPHAPEYRRLFEGGNIRDIDPDDSNRWCQYLGYRGFKRLGYARVSHGGITDTELQVARYGVPPLAALAAATETAMLETPHCDHDVLNYSCGGGPEVHALSRALGDHEHLVGDEAASDRLIPKQVRFPVMFHWPGSRRHSYHVFRRPKFFVPLADPEAPVQPLAEQAAT
ncbi:hypothetical protein H696_03329 [Fonticula alba]|uniref:Uncharacterized protein n=1 Tax=Fonticula alba TaxID=691883 RepID=A0A058Z8K2_FONAL|nr:hypothetical protein H696_03329 [Fonticula alba]KCV69857.1 hypothetical protein H696_03329 [Fonticula alba]|eukprot:XP_009495463.1 hypothetical protein H696_03329 [Fonticula alba]